MRYMGGKSRNAKEISEIILAETNIRSHYYEPFIGGASVFANLAPHFVKATGSDAHEDLILLYNAVMDGWRAPDVITESEWRLQKNMEPNALRGYVGFAASFGGRWFESVARSGTNPDREVLSHSPASLYSLRKKILDSGVRVKFRHSNYDDIYYRSNSVIYCDPPYIGTKPYNGIMPFDHARFWNVMDELVEDGCKVFVSEYTAPDGWKSVWSKNRTVAVRNYDNRQIEAVEMLYTK